MKKILYIVLLCANIFTLDAMMRKTIGTYTDDHGSKWKVLYNPYGKGIYKSRIILQKSVKVWKGEILYEQTGWILKDQCSNELMDTKKLLKQIKRVRYFENINEKNCGICEPGDGWLRLLGLIEYDCCDSFEQARFDGGDGCKVPFVLEDDLGPK